MIVKLNAVKIFYLILLFSFFSVNLMYSQTGEAKSLEIGNKWFYSSSSLDYSQEIIGDTTIQGKHYAIILDTRMDTLYWFQRADSSKIYSFNTTVMEEIVKVDFNTPDTVGFYFTITNDTIFFWDYWRARQCRYDFGGIVDYTHCYVKGLGLVAYSYYGHPPNYSEQLIAGIIEGEFYGDSTVLSIERIDEGNIKGFYLYQNYPNPFNPTTTIVYEIEKSDFIQFKLFNVLGKTIITLINEYKLPGLYEIEFNGKDLPSGVYYYQLRSSSKVETKKMLLLK